MPEELQTIAKATWFCHFEITMIIIICNNIPFDIQHQKSDIRFIIKLLVSLIAFPSAENTRRRIV